MIELLNKTHIESVRHLFYAERYMGVSHDSNLFMDKDAEFLTITYTNFCDTYLSDLISYKAYGSVENGVVTAYIAFYASDDGAEWYWTQIRSKSGKDIPSILDKVIEHNESQGRLKFYSMFNIKYAKTFRRFAFSDYNSERYGMFDEFVVPAKTKCKYSMHWQVLFNRILVPVDSVVRCTFLKQEYRTSLPIAGGL